MKQKDFDRAAKKVLFDEAPRKILFKYSEEGHLSLGVPDEISAEKGHWHDGGCKLKFQTSRLAIGIEEKFFLYLFAGDVTKVTREIWEAFLATEPERAEKDFKALIKIIREEIKKNVRIRTKQKNKKS